MSETIAKIRQFGRDQLKELLNQCTPRQRAFFGRLYPHGINRLGDRQFKNAVRLCEATIRKNKSRED